MRKKCRSVVVAPETQMVTLFDYMQYSNAWTDWKFRTVGQRKAAAMVARGEARPVTRRVEGTVRVVGYQATKPTRARRPSQTTLTVSTSMAVVGLPLGRHGEMTGAEAKHIAKFRMWPFEFDRKNPATVGPAVTELDVRRAQGMLQAA